MAELARNASIFNEKNANLVVIGSGDPKHFSDFRETTGYRELLFTDPDLAVFSFLGFSSGFSRFLSMTSIAKAASALKQGFRQGPVQGSIMQLGGAAVIDPSDNILFYYASSKAGDHPEINRLFKALDGNRV